jgi:hypothetical protein
MLSDDVEREKPQQFPKGILIRSVNYYIALDTNTNEFMDVV